MRVQVLPGGPGTYGLPDDLLIHYAGTFGEVVSVSDDPEDVDYPVRVRFPGFDPCSFSWEELEIEGEQERLI